MQKGLPHKQRTNSGVRVGVIGLGNMGRAHARSFAEHRIEGAVLAAVADQDVQRGEDFGGAERFPTAQALIRSGRADAVVIATPHREHVAMGVAALRAGLHVLVEKPLAADRLSAERLVAAHTNRRQVFAAMFNQRTDPRYRRLRELVRGGELGPVRRIAWTVTDWFRPHAYFASSGWRATWAGEGGGLLLNQCPHNLDLLQWIFGRPKRVRGFCAFGRYHPIEVEDDVTAYFEYAGGLHATFIASTGEAPGTNRLEVAAENGRVVIEPGGMRYTRNLVPAARFSRTSRELFAAPPTEDVPIHFAGQGGQHAEVLQNFVDAILQRTPLIAPAREGLASLELANAILLSAWSGTAVELPISGARYRRWLQRKIAESRRKRSSGAEN